MLKFKVRIEHVSGQHETFQMSAALTQTTIERCLQPGWPFFDISVDGKRIRSRDGDISNSFITTDGEKITI